MTSETREAGGELHHRTLWRGDVAEHHLTGVAGSGASVASARPLLDRLAALLAREGIEPVQEKLYGTGAAREELLGARAAAFRAHGLDPALPVLFLDGAPPHGGAFGGFQLLGLGRHGSGAPLVRSVPLPGGAVARSFCLGGARFLYVPALVGADPDGSLPATATAQAERMFDHAGAALASQGLSFRQVVRTWIYLSRLLDWYVPFNAVRTRRFEAEGLIGAGSSSPLLPASTGIQGHRDSEACIMDLLAIDPGPEHRLQLQPIRASSRQGEAFAYGSSFSRALSVGLDDQATIFVSGTASIDRAGATAHTGDREAQVLATLLNVAALLEEHGGGLRSIASGTLFCKDVAVYEAFVAASRLLSLPRLPLVPVIADVCRPDLLVEIEAVALVGERESRE